MLAQSPCLVAPLVSPKSKACLTQNQNKWLVTKKVFGVLFGWLGSVVVVVLGPGITLNSLRLNTTLPFPISLKMHIVLVQNGSEEVTH